jgi:hypothetical protein
MARDEYVMPQDITDAYEIDERMPLILDIRHKGDAHFGVKLSSMTGGRDNRLVNAIGDFDGKVITPVDPGKFVFEVDFGTEYSIEPVDFGEIHSPPISLSNSDPDVIAVEISNPIKLEVTAHGDEHVGVSLHNHLGDKVDNLINEIGPTSTTTMIRQEGQAFLFFDIRGDWEAEINEI